MSVAVTRSPFKLQLAHEQHLTELYLLDKALARKGGNETKRRRQEEQIPRLMKMLRREREVLSSLGIIVR